MLSVRRQLGVNPPRTFPRISAHSPDFVAMTTKMTRLRERARPITDEEIAQIPWFVALTSEEQTRVRHDMLVSTAQRGDFLVRAGRPPEYWFGLIEGLLKMSNVSRSGTQMTFTGVAPGGWFGEGTVLKREAYRYNIEALRVSLVTGVPVATFHWLIDHSLGFNRYVMFQLNERLGQFIAARETDRLVDPDLRVARNLATLFDKRLYPGVGEVLRITQQELALIVGLSRQRVNEALKVLTAKGWIRTEYGGLQVVDWQALQQGT
jgi:CRP/FNR family transcriptional regulator, cyclic AMP receptor protein